MPEAANQSNRLYQTAQLKNEAINSNKPQKLLTLSVEARAAGGSLKAKPTAHPYSNVDSQRTVERSASLGLGKAGSEHQASFNVLKPRMIHADSQGSGSQPRFLKITIGRSRSNIHNTNQSIPASATRDKEQELRD